MNLSARFTFSLLLIGISATTFGAPVVPGFDRLRGKGPEAGATLLTELSCGACHQGERADWKSGPDLLAAGSRLRPAYVQAFVADPGKVKPGTTMPSLLAGETEGRRAEMAEELTHYLMQQREKTAAAAPVKGDRRKGRDAYQSVGCMACHSTVPLEKLSEKYAPGALARFIEAPLKVRPAGRMPDLHVTAEEAVNIAAFLAPTANDPEPEFAIDKAKADRGGALYQKLGCAACHQHTGAPQKAITITGEGESGCLAEEPKAGVPHYALNARQRNAIKQALASPSTGEPTAAAEVRRLMLQRNCFACHQRDGLGGPTPQAAAFFTSTKDDLGDQGKLPPPLDGAGRKLLLPALKEILQGRQRVRGYMRTHMPDFGEDLAKRLAPLFAAADADPKEKPTTAQTTPNQVGRNEQGRVIVGATGYACIACHDLHGHPSLGIGAYDMAEMPKRLRREWMRDFLINPAAFPTGARMPSFFPNGKPMNSKLGGDAEKQIDHLRVYLTEVDQSLPPEGFSDPAAFEVKATDRPVIFRTFMAGVSTHAIGVGFPQGVNVAFDALSSRWALGWRGRFLDGDGTWNQRVAKMEKPLGDHEVHLGEIGKLSVGDAQPLYRGYRVEKDGVPTFLYDLGKLHVEDRIAPSASGGLRRTLRLSGQTNEHVSLEAKTPKGVTVRIVNDEGKEVTSLAGQSGVISTTTGEKVSEEVQQTAHFTFQNGTAQLHEEISW